MLKLDDQKLLWFIINITYAIKTLMLFREEARGGGGGGEPEREREDRRG